MIPQWVSFQPMIRHEIPRKAACSGTSWFPSVLDAYQLSAACDFVSLRNIMSAVIPE